MAHPTFDFVNSPDRFPNLNFSRDDSILLVFGILGFLFLDVSLTVSLPSIKCLRAHVSLTMNWNGGRPPLELSGTSRKRVSPDATDDVFAFAGYLGK